MRPRVTAASPLRRAKSTKGGGFAAADFPARRAGYGAAPPAPRVLCIALRATALRAAPDPGDHCGPWDQEERAGPGLPRHARGAQKPRGGGHPSGPNAKATDERVFDTHKEQKIYTERYQKSPAPTLPRVASGALP
jgi:hypothetical protein